MSLRDRLGIVARQLGVNRSAFGEPEAPKPPVTAPGGVAVEFAPGGTAREHYIALELLGRVSRTSGRRRVIAVAMALADLQHGGTVAAQDDQISPLVKPRVRIRRREQHARLAGGDLRACAIDRFWLGRVTERLRAAERQ